MIQATQQISTLKALFDMTSIVVGVLTIFSTVVFVTKYLVRGGAEVKAQVDRLTGSIDNLAKAVESGFTRVEKRLDSFEEKMTVIDRRVTRVESANGIDTPMSV